MSATNLEFGDWVRIQSSDGKDLFVDRLVNVVKTSFGPVYYTARNKNVPLPHGTIAIYIKRDNIIFGTGNIFWQNRNGETTYNDSGFKAGNEFTKHA